MGLNPSQQRYCFACFSHILPPLFFFFRSLEIMRFFFVLKVVLDTAGQISVRSQKRDSLSRTVRVFVPLV